MRGKAARAATMLTAVTPDTLAPQHHPIRKIKPMVDRELGQLSPTFDRMYAASAAHRRFGNVDAVGRRDVAAHAGTGAYRLGSDKRIRLTQRGISEGENIAQRHPPAEWVVVSPLEIVMSLLEMVHHEAHVEAHQMEHGMSETLVIRLKERLGNPTHSPFGWPIPGSGVTGSTPGSVMLDSEAGGAPYSIDRVPEENPELLRFLAGPRLVPYHRVTLLEAMPYLGVMQVKTEVDRVYIGYDVARQIVVRRHEPEL